MDRPSGVKAKEEPAIYRTVRRVKAQPTRAAVAAVAEPRALPETAGRGLKLRARMEVVRTAVTGLLRVGPTDTAAVEEAASSAGVAVEPHP